MARAHLSLVGSPNDSPWMESIDAIGGSNVQLDDFRDWLVGLGLSTNTIAQRLAFAESRQREWGSLDQPDHVVVGWLTTYNGWTRRTYLSHLRCLYEWMLETGQIQQSPVRRVPATRTPAPRPNPLTRDELSRVLAAATGDLRTWLLLAYLAGLRCHEIAKIRGEDITETTLYVLGKGAHAAFLPTHPDLWDIAQRYPRTGYWFPSVQARRDHVSTSSVGNQVRAHLREHGIDQGSIHRLRHSYGTELARSGVQVRIVQDLMRHASLNTTMRYLGVDEKERATALRSLVA